MKDSVLEVGYFLLARNISRMSKHRVKVGAVLARKNPIIACSNKVTSHPVFANGSDIRGSLHAEMRCLINCCSDDISGTTVYVYRENKKGKPALARPCAYCLEALKEKGVKKIYFTINDPPYYSWERI